MTAPEPTVHLGFVAALRRDVLKFFGGEGHPTGRQLRRRRTLLSGMLLPLFFLIGLPLAYVGLMHSPTPNGMEISVVGSSSAAEEFVTTAQSGSPHGEFDINQVDSVDEAKDRIMHLDSRAAYDPATGTLYVASAGNATATGAAEAFVTAIAASNDQSVTVENLQGLPQSDVVGAGVMYIGLGAIVAGFLTTTTASIVAPRIRIRTKVIVLGVMSIAAAAVQILISYGITGTLHENMWGAAALAALLAFTCGIVNLAGFVLWGPIQLLVSIGLFIFLGVPASGVPIGIDMASSFYQFLQPLLPSSAALDGLKRIVYFDANGIGPIILTMVIWIAAATVGLVFAHRRRSKIVAEYYAQKGPVADKERESVTA